MTIQHWSAVACACALLPATTLPAQQQPFQTHSASTLDYSIRDGQQAVEISNVAYEMTNDGIPGLPRDQRLILRKTTRTTELVGDIGTEASTTVQAWPLGVDLKEKPLYSLTVSGVEPKTVNSELLSISRGLEEVEWWSVYSLGTGGHLFDTYVPLVQFSTTRDVQTLRYAGLEVPPDDTTDPRLRAPNVIAVLTYASAAGILREALITGDSPKVTRLLRSYADTIRKLTVDSGNRITIAISPTHTMAIPIVKDDLDFARATATTGLRITSWKR
uniref:Uncharacterized protein n=1 Tax=Solibacter usitatus (strain Ellin6076) TaxID=234267 RepID=Q01WN0_SOLUE